MTIPLTILISSFFASALTCFYFLFVRRSHDSEYITLSAKYADAASLLTSMRAKVDDLQEKLDFSEDVRYGLGMDNARMAKRIEELERDCRRGEEIRFMLVDQIHMEINNRIRAERRMESLERSLAIARHKEFKRWKKMKIRSPRYLDTVSPAMVHHWIRNIRMSILCGEINWYDKPLIRQHITKIQSMEPYPLP